MDPKKIHELDQETGPMHELATKLGAYFRSLQEQGFTRLEALRIVIAYQSSIIRSVFRRSDDGR